MGALFRSQQFSRLSWLTSGRKSTKMPYCLLISFFGVLFFFWPRRLLRLTFSTDDNVGDFIVVLISRSVEISACVDEPASCAKEGDSLIKDILMKLKTNNNRALQPPAAG